MLRSKSGLPSPRAAARSLLLLAAMPAMTAMAAMAAMPAMAAADAGAIAASGAAGPGAAAPASADRAPEPWIRESPFIFRGTVEAASSSNLSLLPASAATALVRVGEVIDRPPSLPGPQDTVVTLVLADGAPALPGGRAIFFAAPWLFGENVAVLEQGRIADTADAADLDRLRRQVAAVRATVADEALAARLAGASLVVSGRVSALRPLPTEWDEAEHAAEWVRAEIAVATAEKGQPLRTVTVHFAGAAEELWHEAPKLALGQAGLFVLQPYAGVDLPPGSLVLVHPLDVLAPSQLDRVRRLLQPAAGPRR